MVIRIRRREAAREVALPDADLPVPGRAELALPEGLDASAGRILLQRPDTTSIIELAPGGTAELEGARIAARLLDGRLVLEAEPK